MSSVVQPIRIPVAAPLADRELAYGGAYTTDTMLVNCYVETSQTGRKYVVKRPGLTTAYSYNGGGATNGQGTMFYANGLYAMGSNTLYRLTGAANGSADGTAWTASTAAPWNGRTEFGCIVFNGTIFIMGGANTGGTAYLNDVWSSDDGVNWTQVTAAAPWPKRKSMGLAILGTTLYLIGGNGASTFQDVWSTTDGVNWKQVVVTTPWTKRVGFAVASFNQGIFMLGGLNDTGTDSKEVWFSPDGSNWTQMVTTAAWNGRRFHSAIVYNGKIWIAGGRTGGANNTDVWSTTDGINWTNTGNLPAARENMATCVYNNKMWFVGGYDAAVNFTSTVWSSTDGAAFTVVAASYGGNALEGAALVSYKTPTAVSSINASSMWLIGGLTTVTYSNQVYYATLNVPLPSSWAVGTAGSTTTQFQFTTQNAGAYLVFKNTSDAWVLYSGSVQKITSTNYPQSTVPGVVNLDDTVYVMDSAGVIYGSNLSDPFTWSALNFITADYSSDTAVALFKYRNYVVALKDRTTQFFYDAGRYPGSPLLPVVSANSNTGCAAAGSIAAMENTLFFIAKNETYGHYIGMLDGFNVARISTPDEDRILNSMTNTLAYGFPWKVNGHSCYAVTLKTQNVTLVYDLVEKLWHTLKSGANYFVGINYVTDGAIDYLQDILLGRLYSVIPTVYTDDGAAITVTATGEKVDGGKNDRKFCSSLTVIGDRRCLGAPNPATITWSDDDGQTFNTGVTVDLSLARPRVNRLGSFRRRQHRITHANNNPFRVEAFELDLI